MSKLTTPTPERQLSCYGTPLKHMKLLAHISQHIIYMCRFTGRFEQKEQLSDFIHANTAKYCLPDTESCPFNSLTPNLLQHLANVL